MEQYFLSARKIYTSLYIIEYFLMPEIKEKRKNEKYTLLIQK